MSADTRAIWEWLGAPDWGPPEPKRGERYGQDARCWLCGELAGERPWPRDTWLTPTFTNHTLASAPWSGTICQPCAYLGSGDAWRAYCAAHPERGLKSVPPLGWNSYSHVFGEGLHVTPRRNEWRSMLIDAPAA